MKLGALLILLPVLAVAVMSPKVRPSAKSPAVVAAAVSGTLTRGPYLQKAAPNRMTIRWRSSAAVVGRVRYGTSAASLNLSADEVSATTEHIVELTGLAANTIYFYSVGSATDTLASGTDFYFRTSPAAGTAVSTRVWVLGDAGTATANQTAVRDAFYTWTGAQVPNLVLQLGDNAYNSGTDAEFQNAVFNIYPTMMRKVPFWSCLGNHETAQATAFVDTYPFFDIYTFPAAGECGGVPSGTKHYYSFDYGNIHFVCLDSMTASRSAAGAMATWLQSDLASTTARWIVCYFHHPPYTKGSHNSDTETELIEMRQNLLPILEVGGVDLVLSGHSHCYERSKLIDGFYATPTLAAGGTFKNSGDGRTTGAGAYVKPLTGPRDHFGAVYAVAGSAGQATSWTGGSTALVNPTPHPVMFASLLRLGSMVLEINGNRLDASFLNSSGVVEDTFTVIKQGAADSDGDGVADAFEIANGMNRFDPSDATLDTDKDGNTALAEYLFGLNPQAPDRYAWNTTRNPTTGFYEIRFSMLPQRVYQVFWSDDLAAWHPGSAVVSGDGATKLWIDDGTVTGTAPSVTPRRFYRVQVGNGP